MILEVDNVELYFNQRPILKGVYLKAETGKVTGLLGRNGCGKTSLFSIIFGTLQPKYKLVRLDGSPILKPLYQTGKIGFLPQHELIPKNLKLTSMFKLMKVNWFEFIVQFETFTTYGDLKINKLSGGERRVIETYLVLKSKRPFIVLDEPFSHIAPIYIEKIKRLIDVEKRTKAIILTDHYFRDVIAISDSLYLLTNGCTKMIDDLTELEDYKYLNSGMLS